MMLNAKPMLRPLANARPIGPLGDPAYVKLKGCPDCDGRGWFVLRPFAETNRGVVQCPTCLAAKIHFDQFGELPADIQAAMVASAASKLTTDPVEERRA